MRLDYRQQDGWPPLAWVARVTGGRDERALAVTVFHGGLVETREQWCCEAAWAGDFADGDFDLTDVVAGTGVRLRDGTLRFVSSGATVDRLQYLRRDDATWVSNSLPALLAGAGERLEPGYPHYQRDLFSIVRGIGESDGYARSLPAASGRIGLCYFHNLEWRDGALVEVPKPGGDRGFEDFDSYEGFLRESIAAVATNMGDAARERRRYRFMGSLSTGYDSTTVTALARNAGLRKVICFSNESLPPERRERGADLAGYFGVKPIEIGLDDWRRTPMAEVPFVAADCFGEEAQYCVLRNELAGSVYLSGYHGDKIWGRDNPFPDPFIRRGDPSGGALSEFRLQVGFLHLSVPFLGCRAARDVLAISRSDAMREWHHGGDYSRPICRRIVEGAGVPRDAFARAKAHASRWMASEPELVSDASRASLREWIDMNAPHFKAHGRQRPWLGPRAEATANRLMVKAGRALGSLPGAFRLGVHKWPLTGHLMNMAVERPYQPPAVVGAHRYVFPWAVDLVRHQYASPDFEQGNYDVFASARVVVNGR